MLETDREAYCNRNLLGLDAQVEYIAGHLFESALLRKIEEHLLSRMDRILPLGLKYNPRRSPRVLGPGQPFGLRTKLLVFQICQYQY